MTGSRAFLFAAVLLAAAVGGLAPLPPQAVERAYGQWLYPIIQPAVTGISSLVPIAVLDAAAGGAVVLALVLLGRQFVRRPAQTAAPAAGRTRSPRAMLQRGGIVILWLAGVSALLYVWFLLSWGLNYRRVPLEEKLAYDHTRVTRERAVAFAHETVRRLNELSGVPAPVPTDDDALAAALATVERAFGAPGTTRTAMPKRSLLGWYFRRAAIDGMTDPFFLEIILNPDLLPFERPFVLAHEWAHLAGYADESEANFVAWLACLRATPATQYSGWIAAFEHVTVQLARPERRELRAALAPGVIADLDASHQRLSRSNRAVRTAARGVYDAYLRANRMEEGISSYNAVVRLMLGTTLGPDWTPELRR